MKDKVINKILREKKPFASIFLIVSSLCLLVIPVFSILMMTDATFKENIDIIKECFLLFGSIGILGLGITIYLMKFTNKLNTIKISKDELEKLYDEHIDDKIIGNVENNCEQVKRDYETIKNSPHTIVIPIIVILISIFIGFIFNWSEFIIYLFAVSIVVSSIYLCSAIKITSKPIDKLVEEIKEEQILEIFSSKISNRNKEIIKENKKEKTKRKNPLLFWGIEVILLLWCLAAFNGDVLSLVEEEGVYGSIALVIIFGLPAFFFVRNIYTRYVKQTK